MSTNGSISVSVEAILAKPAKRFVPVESAFVHRLWPTFQTGAQDSTGEPFILVLMGRSPPHPLVNR